MIQLHEKQESLNRHEDSRNHRHEESECTSWLGNDDDGVHDAVHNSGDGSGTNHVNGQKLIRVGENVQQRDSEEGQNVLQVVAMCSRKFSQKV